MARASAFEPCNLFDLVDYFLSTDYTDSTVSLCGPLGYLCNQCNHVDYILVNRLHGLYCYALQPAGYLCNHVDYFFQLIRGLQYFGIKLQQVRPHGPTCCVSFSLNTRDARDARNLLGASIFVRPRCY